MYRGVYIKWFRTPRIYSWLLDIQNTYEALKVMHTKFSNLAKNVNNLSSRFIAKFLWVLVWVCACIHVCVGQRLVVGVSTLFFILLLFF